MAATKQNRSHTLSRAFITTITASVKAGRHLRRKLPIGGRIHIDRHLPFLCVYRQPAHDDPGTERLLYGEAAYLLAPGSRRLHDALNRLVTALAAAQIETCGSLLLVELWARGTRRSAPTGDHLSDPAFRIIAPTSNAPVTTLEVLQQALLVVKLPGVTTCVNLDYGGKCAPPGMKPLLSAAQSRQLGCVLIGLEVTPVYRDAKSGKPYPFVLRVLHRGISRALQRSFYEFSHCHSRQQPLHYLALGRRAMTRALWEADQKLAAISDCFDLLLHVTPVNGTEAWHVFRRRRFQSLPEFHYRPRSVDPAQLKRALYLIRLEQIEDPVLSFLFEEKRQELDRKLSLLDARGRSSFLYGSMQLFGVPDDSLLNTARDILEQLSSHSPANLWAPELKATDFARRARTEIAHYRRMLPSMAATVRVRADISGLIVSQGQLLIGQNTRVGAGRVEAAIQHEVGTHLLTYYNGLAQPLRQLHIGLAGYDETQEGLAVLAEYLSGGLSRSRLQVLAARVIAVQHLCGGADFIETFQQLHENLGFDASQAFQISMRVYRGGGLTKDIIYLRGLLAILEYLATDGKLETLLLGKYGLHQIDLITALRWRQVLVEAPLRPRYLDNAHARQRLKALQTGKGIRELLTESGG